jgi:hypothetical protein
MDARATRTSAALLTSPPIPLPSPPRPVRAPAVPRRLVQVRDRSFHPLESLRTKAGRRWDGFGAWPGLLYERVPETATPTVEARFLVIETFRAASFAYQHGRFASHCSRACARSCKLARFGVQKEHAWRPSGTRKGPSGRVRGRSGPHLERPNIGFFGDLIGFLGMRNAAFLCEHATSDKRQATSDKRQATSDMAAFFKAGRV